MTQPVKRSYDASRRRAQARATQREVLRAAHDLFVQQGYGRTTIAQVAERAGVSTETIYATFKNKATLLHRTWDVTIGGDDEEVVFHERPEIQAIRAACREVGDFSLEGMTLYASCEPCPMCIGAALWARLDRVVYAADREDAARGGFDDRWFHDLFAVDRAAWPMRVEALRVGAAVAPFEAWAGDTDRIPY